MGAAAGGVGSVFDWSEQHGKEWMGDLQYGIAQGGAWLGAETPLGSPGFLNLPLIPGAPGSAQRVINAHEQGFNGYTGGRAVWEDMQSDNPMVVRGAMDVLNPADPINLVGYLTGANAARAGIGGLAAGTGKAGLPELGQSIRMAENAGVGMKLAGYGVEGAGRAAWAGLRASEIPGEIAFKYLIAKPIGAAARNTVGRFGLLDPSNETKFGRMMADIRLGANELTSVSGASGTNRLSGIRNPKINDIKMAPVSASPKLRGSILGQKAESMADAAWSKIMDRFGGAARTGITPGVMGPIGGSGFNASLPTAPAGFNASGVPRFSSEDIDNFASFSAAFIVGRMNQAPQERQVFAMLNAIDDLPAELGRRTQYTPQNLAPIMPTIVNRTGLSELPDPRYFGRTGFAENNLAIRNTKEGRTISVSPVPGSAIKPDDLPAELAPLASGQSVNVRYSDDVQAALDRLMSEENPRVTIRDSFDQVMSGSDYASALPGKTSLRVGDELSAMGAGGILGARKPFSEQDLASYGFGSGFRTGDEMFSAGYRVTITPTNRLKKSGEELPDDWDFLRSVGSRTVTASSEDMVFLQSLADDGLIKIKVKDDGGLVAPSSYGRVLSGEQAGPDGLAFDFGGESPRDHIERIFRERLGPLWDQVDEPTRREIWRKSVQSSYVMMVQSAQEAYMAPSKLADLYLKASAAGEDVTNLAGRYSDSFKRVYTGIARQFPSGEASGKIARSSGEIDDEVIDDIANIAMDLSESADPFMDKIAHDDLMRGLDLSKQSDRQSLIGRYETSRQEMSQGSVSTTGSSAITPDNPTGYSPNSMSAIFNEDVYARRAAMDVINDPNASPNAKQLAEERLRVTEAFEDNPADIDPATGLPRERMVRNVHGQARPVPNVRESNPSGTYPVNMATLMHAIRQGVDLNLGDRATREWYAGGVLEMDALFGKGAIDDVYAFTLMLAATSAQAGPDSNLANALRLWTISLLGNDPQLLADAGISRGEATRLNEILNDLLRVGRADIIGGNRSAEGYASEITAGTASKVGKPVSAGDLPALGVLTSAHTRQSAQAVGQAIGEDSMSRLARGLDPSMGVPTQGGPKFADYAGSFTDQSVRDSIERAYADDTALGKEILDLWDASQSQFTIDRHQNALNAFNVVVHPFHYRTGRFLGQQATDLANMDPAITAALKNSKLRPEDVQAITWYYAKGAKGFARKSEKYNDDLGRAIKRRLGELDGEFRAASREQKKAMINTIVKDIVTNKHLVSPGKIDSSRIGLITGELMASVRKMRHLASKGEYADPISYAYRLADPKVYRATAGRAGLEPLNIVRGYTTTLGGTPMTVNGMPFLSFDMPDEEIAKRIGAMLNQYESALSGPYGDMIKIGFYPNGNQFSVDLNLVVGDEVTAREIATSTNQIAAFNNNTFEDIPTHGDGTSPLTNGDQVNAFLDEKMSQKIGQRLNGEATGAIGPDHGFRTAQPNFMPPELEPLSYMLESSLGYMGDYLRLFFDVFQSYQMKFSMGGFGNNLKDARRGFRAKRISGISRGLADELVQMSAPVKNPLLSNEANRVLYDQGFDSGVFEGDTFGEALTSLEYFIGAIQDGVKKSGGAWNPDATVEQKMKLFPSYSDDDQKKKIIKLLAKYNLDPLADDPMKLALMVVERELEKQFGVQHDRLTGMKLFRAAWGEQALFTPRYHAGNLLGAWMQNIIGGHSINIDPVDFARNIRMATGSATEGFTNPRNSKWVETLDKWGFGSEIRQLNKVNNATMGLVSGNLETTSAIGKIAKKVMGERAGNIIGKPFELNKQFSAGVEMSIRGGLVSETIDREMSDRVVELSRIAAERMAREGVDSSAISPEIFSGSPEQVMSRLKSTGLSKGQSEHISRTYANFRRTALDKGIKEVERIQFSYEYTNLDELVSKVVPFHYWASRAMRFYVEETLRHPVFIYNYVRMTEGIDRMNQDPGLSARQKGFLRLMQGPTGFTLLMNPDALMGVVKSLKIDNTYEPEGETTLGGLIRRGKEHGVGLFPWIDGIMNYIGAYGDSFAPDPLGIRHRSLVGAAINEFRAHAGMEPGTAPYEAFNTKLREFISTNFDAATPDWLGQPVAVKNSRDGTMATATMDDLITTRIMESNPGITNGELIEILSDPESPEYQAAYKQVANAGLLQQVLGVTIPTNIRVREDSRDANRAGMNLIREEAKKVGASPYEYEPTPADIEFYESYRKLTGRDYKPGDMDRMQLKRDIQTSTPQARRFVIQKHEYDNLGTSNARHLQRRIGQIVNGEWFPPGVQPGQYDPDVLWGIARDWASVQRSYPEYLELRQMRDMYLSTHPEFGEYDSWRDSMYNVVSNYGPTGLSYYRQKVSENNPGAKNYFDRRMSYIIENNPQATPDEIRQQLDQATISPDTWFAVSGRAMSQYSQSIPNAGGYYDPVVFNAPMAESLSGGASGPQAPGNWMQALQVFGR